MIPSRGTSGMAGRARASCLAAWTLLAATTAPAADLAVALADAPVGESSGAADPLAGTPWVDPASTGPDAERILASLLPERSDSPGDWHAPLEPLHACGEPRVLPRCVPPPPCHPALPPRPHDLVGVRGLPTCGPIYGGPCAPRTGAHDDGRLPRLHRVPDRLFDWFYGSR